MLLCGLLPSCMRRAKQDSRILLLNAVIERPSSSLVAETLNQRPNLATGVVCRKKKDPLHVAAERGNLSVVSAVVEAVLRRESELGRFTSVASVLNAQDAQGQTALFIACAYGHVTTVNYLLANGADRMVCDVFGNMPLHVACMRGHVSIAFMLLDEYVSDGRVSSPGHVDAQNADGLTPLHLAVWCQRTTTVQVLLQHGANLNVGTHHQLPEMPPLSPHIACAPGTQPLHLAASRGHIHICRSLLQAHYERTVAFRAGSPNAPADAGPPDPREAMNGAGHLPHHVALRTGYVRLSAMLRPSVPLYRLFEPRSGHHMGPASLKAIASAAHNAHLHNSARKLCRLKQTAVEAKAHAAVAAAAQGGAGALLRRTSSLRNLCHASEGNAASGVRRGRERASSVLASCSLPALLDGVAASAAAAGEQHAPGSGECPSASTSAKHPVQTAVSRSASRHGTPPRRTGTPPQYSLHIDANATDCGFDMAELVKGEHVHAHMHALGNRLGCRMVGPPGLAARSVPAVRSSCLPAVSAVLGGAGTECGVCLEDTLTLCMVPCGHEICGECMLGICSDTSKAATCPFCRGHIAGLQIDTLFPPC